jgi:hypothetical protein
VTVKTKTKAPILDEPVPAPLAGPQTEGEWLMATHAAMKLKKDVTLAERAEYRKMLELYPELSKDHGELHKMYNLFALEVFQGQPIIEESVKHRLVVMRADLAGPTPSALELLLVDVVLSAYQDYWQFAMIAKQKTAKSFTLEDMEKWERVLSSKETRYLRAIAALARVRRLLNLSAPQVNINMPGGQQVNVNGDVKP